MRVDGRPGVSRGERDHPLNLDGEAGARSGCESPRRGRFPNAKLWSRVDASGMASGIYIPKLRAAFGSPSLCLRQRVAAARARKRQTRAKRGPRYIRISLQLSSNGFREGQLTESEGRCRPTPAFHSSPGYRAQSPVRSSSPGGAFRWRRCKKAGWRDRAPLFPATLEQEAGQRRCI
jgi:hypothetical protein